MIQMQIQKSNFGIPLTLVQLLNVFNGYTLFCGKTELNGESALFFFDCQLSFVKSSHYNIISFWPSWLFFGFTSDNNNLCLLSYV